jgi:phosphoserine phosphatase RsbU/P
MPTLLFLSGERAGTRVPIVGDRFVLGREADCDLTLSAIPAGARGSREDSVSRRHVLLTCIGGQWFAEDGNGRGRRSRNGVRVNGQWVRHPNRVPLHHNDQLLICDILLAFHLDPESTFTPEASVSHSDSRLGLQVQSAERLRLLLDVSTALRGTLDPDTVLDLVLEHLFRMFPQSERGIVVSRESPDRPLAVRAVRTPREGAADQQFSTTVVRRCVESLKAELGNDLPAQFPDSSSISALSGRSLMIAPLWTTEGKALGAIQLDTAAERKFTGDDLRLFLGVASQASMALSNARLHREALAHQRREQKLEVAELVQRALLPRALPDLPGYAFHAHYAAAERVGGDYYDFVPRPSGRLAVLLGDVSGHGVAAALVMARFGALARACLEAEDDPAAVVARLNGLVLRTAVPDSFVTLAAVVLDPTAHAAVVVSAGHPSPLLRRADGSIEQLVREDSYGFPLGIVTGQTYQLCRAALGPGEAILLFSDGVTDAMDLDGRPFRADGLRSVLATAGPSPRAVVEGVAAAVARHAAGADQHDDITMVCLARTAE